jgi:hypothetical protein
MRVSKWSDLKGPVAPEHGLCDEPCDDTACDRNNDGAVDMQINRLLEHDIDSTPDADAPKSAIWDAVQQTEAVVEDPQGNRLSTDIDGLVGLDNLRTCETYSKDEVGDPFERAQTCILATLAGLNAVLLTAEQNNPLSTEIDGHVGLDSSTQRTFETNSKGETGDPLDRTQTCISATLVGLNAVLLTAEREFSRAGSRGSDPVLMYGPPRVRDRCRPTQPAAPRVEWPRRRLATVRVGRSLVEMSSRLTLRLPPASSAGALVEAPPRLTLEPRMYSGTAAMTQSRDFWRVMLHAGGVHGFAAFVVWVVVSTPSARRSGHEAVQSYFSGAPILPDLGRQAAVPAAVPAPSENRDAQVAVTNRPAPEHTRQIDPDELPSLLRRGDDFVNFRDLSSARLLYRRAAEAGSVHAALALAGTFDPNVLKKLGFPENVGEVTKAHLWYELVQQLGSAEAPQRLQQFATLTNATR